MERIQRKPGFPVANCSIKMPDGVPAAEVGCEDDSEQQHRRQQLINFAHSQWGFNNWSWSVTKQDLDFVDFANGKYTAGVVAFVSISVKSFDIHRENIGYATSLANNKGFAIYKARKCAVTNALRETLLSFGGALATDLLELIESRPTGLPSDENNQNAGNKPAEPHARKEPERAPHAAKSVPVTPPVAKALPMPASLPPPVRPPAPPVPPGPPGPPPGPRAPVRPGSNELKTEDEEARAERKRRQRQAQEEFRLKQLLKQKDDKDSSRNNATIDRLLLAIPSQDIVIEDSCADGKRKSPGPEGGGKRRAAHVSKLDIVTTN